MKTIITTTLLFIMIVTTLAIGKTIIQNPEKSSQTMRSNTDYIVLGMGCFWGAEKRMSEISGVIDVESGYAGGDIANANYQQILAHEKALRAGKATARNHAEVIKVTFWQNFGKTITQRKAIAKVMTLEAIIAALFITITLPSSNLRKPRNTSTNRHSIPLDMAPLPLKSYH